MLAYLEVCKDNCVKQNTWVFSINCLSRDLLQVRCMGRGVEDGKKALQLAKLVIILSNQRPHILWFEFIFM